MLKALIMRRPYCAGTCRVVSGYVKSRGTGAIASFSTKIPPNTTSSSSAESSLAMFPEYSTAYDAYIHGHFHRALPQFTRILEICSSMTVGATHATPGTSEMIAHILKYTVGSYCSLNQPTKALDAIKNNCQALLLPEVILTDNLKVLILIQMGKIDDSLVVAKKSMKLAEELLDKGGEINYFSPTCALLGDH